MAKQRFKCGYKGHITEVDGVAPDEVRIICKLCGRFAWKEDIDVTFPSKMTVAILEKEKK